jgi:hypothetical protein
MPCAHCNKDRPKLWQWNTGREAIRLCRDCADADARAGQPAMQALTDGVLRGLGFVANGDGWRKEAKP